MSADALIFALPPVPITRDTLLNGAEHFRRAKLGVLGCGCSGPTGALCSQNLLLVRSPFCA